MAQPQFLWSYDVMALKNRTYKAALRAAGRILWDAAAKDNGNAGLSRKQLKKLHATFSKGIKELEAEDK